MPARSSIPTRSTRSGSVPSHRHRSNRSVPALSRLARAFRSRTVPTPGSPPGRAAPVRWPGGTVLVRRLADHRGTVGRRLVLSGGPPGRPADRSPGRSRSAAEVGPPPGPHALRGLLAVVLEVLGGRRPAGQLGTVLPAGVGRALLAAAGGTDAGSWRLRSVRASRPAPGALELSATVEHGRRALALVGRLEPVAGSWRCTRLDLV